MSSSGNLATGSYTSSALEMARDAGREFVIGFIAMSRAFIEKGKDNTNGKGEEGEEAEEDWLIMTPGVGLGSKGDGKGQNYKTPKEVVGGGSDVIIVGRGIYGIKGGEEEVRAEAERYREEGWKAYLERVGGK
jgi:orotidine-5'-phosphate decarboxylase